MEPIVESYRTPAHPRPDWAVEGAAGRPPRVVRSLHLQPAELERHNDHLQAKYREIAAHEVRWAGERLEDAELAIVAYGTAARVARTAVGRLRDAGIRAGLFRPISLWPFPSEPLAELATRVRAILVVELSAGQMVEDVRLAVEGRRPVGFHGRTGGMVPAPGEVVEAARRLLATTEVAR
jgi:2-oxoglutarate ferredoxin oxidoreductase subunit alpha